MENVLEAAMLELCPEVTVLQTPLIRKRKIRWGKRGV